LPRRVHPAQMEIPRVRLRMTKGKGLTTTNRNVVRGSSLVPGLGLHDLKRSHYRRVGSSGGEIAALPHSLCSGLRLTAMTWRWRERMSKLASLRLFITLVRLSLGTKSASTSGRCFNSPATNRLNSSGIVPIQRGGATQREERLHAPSQASQGHSSVNSRDTIIHKVKDKSGLMAPEYSIQCHINSVRDTLRRCQD